MNQALYPLVSVVIACYNHEKYVVETLDSILADEYPNKEIVIINDGSKDRSDEIVKKWISGHEGKINVTYRFRPNVGVCKTINELVDLSTGKYIVPVPSDDLLMPGSIAPRVKLLQQTPGKMVVISDAVVIDEHSKEMMPSCIENYNHGDKSRFRDDESILLSTLKKPQISGPTIMIDRDIYKITGRYKENMIAEDWYFYQRAAADKRMIFQDLIAGKYRVHSSNNSGANMKGSTRMARTIILTYCYNWHRMPGLKYKAIALTELFKWSVRFAMYKFKS